MTTNDLGNTGIGGPLADSDSVTINVSGVNDGPINNVPGTQIIDEDNVLTFTAANGNLIWITDVDSNSGLLKVTLNSTHGTLTLSQITGLTFTTGDGAADGSMVFTGTLSDINAAVNNINVGFDGCRALIACN